MTDRDLAGLPGQDLFNEGLADLRSGRMSVNSILVLAVAPRFRRLGFQIPVIEVDRPYEHRLYSLLEERMGDGAYSYFKSLLRRMDSLAHSLERESQQA